MRALTDHKVDRPIVLLCGNQMLLFLFRLLSVSFGQLIFYHFHFIFYRLVLLCGKISYPKPLNFIQRSSEFTFDVIPFKSLPENRNHFDGCCSSYSVTSIRIDFRLTDRPKNRWNVRLVIGHKMLENIDFLDDTHKKKNNKPNRREKCISFCFFLLLVCRERGEETFSMSRTACGYNRNRRSRCHIHRRRVLLFLVFCL